MIILQKIEATYSSYDESADPKITQIETAEQAYECMKYMFGTELLRKKMLEDDFFLAEIKKKYKIDIEQAEKIREQKEFMPAGELIAQLSRLGLHPLNEALQYEVEIEQLYAPIDKKLVAKLYPNQYKKIQETIEKKKQKNAKRTQAKKDAEIAKAKQVLADAGVTVVEK